MKQVIGAQGEVTILKIDAIPENMQTKPAERDAQGRFIIAHSESGHHHVVTGGEVMERVSDVPDGMQQFYAIFKNAERLVQDAPTPHEGYLLEPGFYCFKIAREYDPFAEQARRVAD
jgi:hypothetical protein